jgi:GTP-binding protein
MLSGALLPMKIKSAEFVVSALSPESFPQTSFPEFALIGRSNVGKSSLVNLLTERRGLSKVSTTPGKTVMINFFKINGSWFLVDLPGYGFAKVARSRREDFNDLVATYIETRPNLACLFVLIDARLPPQPIDLQFIEQLSSVAVNFALVFTKIDKQSPTRTRESIEAFTTCSGNVEPNCLSFSPRPSQLRPASRRSMPRSTVSARKPGPNPRCGRLPRPQAGISTRQRTIADVEEDPTG